MLSHELRTPLTPVLAAVSSEAMTKDLPESVKETLEIIRRNIEIEAGLIEE